MRNDDDSSYRRYARQIALPEIGESGQEALGRFRVVIVGAGGLGSPAGLYLAGSGVGVLGLVDDDLVELSNLQRQPFHGTGDVGRLKVESAAESIRKLNSGVMVRPYAKRLAPDNALGIIRDYDFVVDATDNFLSKFLIADACHFLSVPYCHAGILAFKGQVMTVVPGQSACYRCLFSEPPPQREQDCHPAGPLGAVPGVIGAIQATEALKYALGCGRLLTNRLLTYDALDMRFRVVSVPREAACPLCGRTPRITDVHQMGQSTSKRS